MTQVARNTQDAAISTVFVVPELRSHIAIFVAWHSSFNSYQANAGFANRCEEFVQRRTVSFKDQFTSEVLMRPKL